MTSHTRFHLRDLDALRRELDALGLQLPIEEDLSILGDQVPIAARRTPNRFVIQPMEGFDSTPDGSPGKLSFRRYERYAAGGSGLIWFEATAILHEARSNPHQSVLHAGNVDVYARLVETTRRAAQAAFGRDVIVVIQLTHSGRYSKPTGLSRPMIAHHSAVLDPKHNLPADYPLVSDEYLDRLQDVYVEAARLAGKAGFDGVDVKACHRYLVSELLASHTREGKYGGPLENRSRLLREVIQKIRDAAPGLAVTTRINVYDAIPYPFGFGVSPEMGTGPICRNGPKAGTMRSMVAHKLDLSPFPGPLPDLTEPIAVIRQLRGLGIPLVNVTIGNPYYNPHYGRPYDRPIAGVNVPDEHPLAGVARLVDVARQVQQAFPDLPVVATGYSWLRHLMPYLAAGVIRSGWATLIGQGRSAFAYPDAAKDILTEGRMKPQQTCVTCSGCSQIMRDGTMTGCVVRDKEIYGEQYKLGRRFALDRLRAEALRCRDCEFPTCTANCPARVDVPAFIRAFADGRIQEAYDVLRRSNVLPEMCACVCPAEVQCEGGCLEQIFSDYALPIRDIQLAVSRLARQAGLTGVRLPPEPTGRRVAVVGAGPAGLACAIRLLEMGHLVTIFEKGDRLGGVPSEAIPADRYQEAAEEIEAILAPAKAAGRIEIRSGHALGHEIALTQLRRQYDAVFLAIGLPGSTSLGTARGVTDAITFLRDVKRGRVAQLSGRVAVPQPLPSPVAGEGSGVRGRVVQDAESFLYGRKVAVLGGGNTAIDAAVTARQLGAEDVYLVYRRSLAEMPAWPDERKRLLESGCHPMILTQPLGYETDEHGTLTGLRIARTELATEKGTGPICRNGPEGASHKLDLSPFPRDGRRTPRVIPGTESVLDVDLVVEALGQGIPAEMQAALEGLELTRHGLVATQPDSQATSLPGVFAGGDLTNGGTTAVQGIAEGMRAAEEIDRLITARAPHTI